MLRSLVLIAMAASLTVACSKKDGEGGGSSGKGAAAEPLTLDQLDGLTIQAPGGSSVSEMMGDQMVQGPGLVVTIGAATDSFSKTIEDEKKEIEMYSPTNISEEALDDGWILTFENKGSAGTNYWVTARREIGGKAYKCSANGPSADQQKNAVAACKSLTK